MAQEQLVKVLLREHGTTFAEEIGISLKRETPSGLFRLLCASLLFGARISSPIATSAARALSKEGWTSAARMSASSWEERTRVLNRCGYARYDESTSRMLGALADSLTERYRGDLRRLRALADRQPREERRRLREFKGMGEVSVDIFFREAQALWPELYPFADRRALKAARRLKLGSSPEALSQLVAKPDLPRLLAALVRVDLGRSYQQVERDAS